MDVNKTRPYIIGVCGGSGSGKTSFVHMLRTFFEEGELTVFSQDDYYLPRDQQALDSNSEHNFDQPESIDRARYRDDLGRLIAGEPLDIEEYHFNNPLREPVSKRILPAPVLLLEGIFLFHFSEIFDQLDLRIFMEAHDNLKVIRRIRRDRVERNYPLEDVLYRYENHVLPAYTAFIAPYKDRSDIIINNNEGFASACEMLAGGIRARLSR